jgi:hypothetical protein
MVQKWQAEERIIKKVIFCMILSLSMTWHSKFSRVMMAVVKFLLLLTIFWRAQNQF